MRQLEDDEKREPEDDLAWEARTQFGPASPESARGSGSREEPGQVGGWRRIARLAWPALVLAVIIPTAMLTLTARLSLVSWGNDLDYFESFIVETAMGHFNGRFPELGSPSSPPYNLVSYPPGSYLVLALAGRLCGVGLGEDGRWVAREVTLACSLLAGLVASLFARGWALAGRSPCWSAACSCWLRGR